MTSPTQNQLENNFVYAIGQSYNRPENRNPGQWDGPITEGKLGSFSFTNQVKGKPLDLVRTRLWSSWGIDIDKCKVCNGGPFSATYEVDMEWGDTKKYEYISEVCSRCLNTINHNIARNGNPEKTY